MGVLERGCDHLRGAGTPAVHQHHERAAEAGVAPVGHEGLRARAIPLGGLHDEPLVEEGVGHRDGLAEQAAAVVAQVEDQPLEWRLVLGLERIDRRAELGAGVLLEAVEPHRAVAGREQLALGGVGADHVAGDRELELGGLALDRAGEVEFEDNAGGAAEQRDRLIARLAGHGGAVDRVDAVAVDQAGVEGWATLDDPLHQHALGDDLHLDSNAHILAVVVLLEALELLGVVEGAVGVELLDHAAHCCADELLGRNLMHVAAEDHGVGGGEDVELSILLAARSSVRREGECATHAEGEARDESCGEVAVAWLEFHGLEARSGGGWRQGGISLGTASRVGRNQRSGSMGMPAWRSSK